MRLWQRLFLACAALSVLTLAGHALWQQRLFARGFIAYLDAVAAQRAQRVAGTLADAYALHGDWEFLRGNPRLFGELVGEPGPPFPPPPGPRPERGDAAMPRENHPAVPFDGAWRPPHDPPVHAGGRRAPPPGGYGGRLRLVDAQGRYVIGARDADRLAASVTVTLDGERIGSLAVTPLHRVDGGLEAEFARTQWRGALVTAAVIVPLALLLAFALARRLLGPVRALSEGTRALAAGRYDLRLPEQGHDEITALARDFNHLADTLERHRRARQRWGQDIAHELRTPLTVLQAELQTLIEGVRPTTEAALASLLAECERLAALVEDFHQLALADSAALEYRFAQVDFPALVEGVLDAHRGALVGAGLTVDVELPEEPLIVRGDRIRLAQLVDNLLLNARRHTDAPGRVAVRLSPRGRMLRFTVEDSPPGVCDHDLPRLFERLFRTDRSRGRASGGSGLGLAICRSIAGAHGGSIAARHSALGGLAVDVELPQEPTERGVWKPQ